MKQGTACLGCGWDEENWDAVNHEQGGSGCVALAATGPELPATLALPGLAETVAGLGTIQATRLLLGEETGHVMGREWRLNISAGRLDETKLDRDPQCRMANRLWSIVELDQSPCKMTVRDLFDRATEYLGKDVVLGAYDDPLVFGAGCPKCRCEVAMTFLRRSMPLCTACNGTLVPLAREMRVWFDREETPSLLDRTWAKVGLGQGGAVLAKDPGRTEEILFLFGSSHHSDPDEIDQGPLEALRCD